MSMYAFTGTETAGVAGPGAVMSGQAVYFFCGMPYAAQGVALDMTPIGPGTYPGGDPTNTIMGMGMVFAGLPSTMGNVVGPSGATSVLG